MKAIISVSNQIEMNMDELNTSVLNCVRKNLTLDNPDYIKAIKMGYSTYRKEQKLKIYRYEGHNIVIPRGFGQHLSKIFKMYHQDVSYIDNQLTLEPVEFHSKIKLRSYQVPAVEALVKGKQGGVVAGCGSGKTQIMLEAMARIGQPALWICHSYELLNQTLERACSVFDGMTKEEIGIIANGKVSIGERLTMALVQTLSKADIESFKDKFGAIFIDEAHHTAAVSFYHPIGQFPAKYRLWASATPERADGLTDMVYAAGGPILHTIEQKELPTIVPELVVIETNCNCRSEEYTNLITGLSKDKARNEILIKTIAQEAPGNYSLVLSERREHLVTLKEMLDKTAPKLRTAILTGTMKKPQRAKVMEQIKNKELDLLFATQLAREGLDITHLNKLFLVTPKRAAAVIQQEVGRIMRPSEGKEKATVYDFWDVRNPMLKAQFWSRRKVYMNLGMYWSPKLVRRAQ